MRLKRPAGMNIGIDLDGDVIARIARALSLFRPLKSSTDRNGERRRQLESPEVSRADHPAARSPHAEIDEDTSSRIFDFRQTDGITFLESHRPTGHTLIYCDPPYLMQTRSGKRLYAHEMTVLEHRRLLRVLQDLKCMVMISGYSHPLYARELKKWNVASYQTTTRGGKPVAEWLWYNFPRPVELHDYRYLGSNYREREKIKRQQKRWKGRLARMDTLPEAGFAMRDRRNRWIWQCLRQYRRIRRDRPLLSAASLSPAEAKARPCGLHAFDRRRNVHRLRSPRRA